MDENSLRAVGGRLNVMEEFQAVFKEHTKNPS